MNEKINNLKIGCLIATVLLLSGCASVQIVGKPASLKYLPSTVVIGDIVPANEEVNISPEKIKEGQEILFKAFKKELPEFTVIKSIQDIPPGVENYLLVKTRIIRYHESRPEMLLTVVYWSAAMSFVDTEIVIAKYKENEDLYKLHASGAMGLAYGKSAAYTKNLEAIAKELAKIINKYAGK